MYNFSNNSFKENVSDITVAMNTICRCPFNDERVFNDESRIIQFFIVREVRIL